MSWIVAVAQDVPDVLPGDKRKQPPAVRERAIDVSASFVKAVVNSSVLTARIATRAGITHAVAIAPRTGGEQPTGQQRELADAGGDVLDRDPWGQSQRREHRVLQRERRQQR